MKAERKAVFKLILKESLKGFWEAFISVLPIVIIVSIFFAIQYGLLSSNQISTEIISVNAYITFLICSLFLCIGMNIFTHGSDMSMSKIGKYIGEDLTKKKSIILLVIFIILLGTIITIAEPDLAVLSEYIPKETLNPWIFRLLIGVGVGVFFAIGIYRIIANKSIKYWVSLFYGIIFMVASLFGDDNQAFLELSFDSGGVTTGPITIPFLLAFGIGIAGAKGGNKASENSFGLSGICSIGPVIVVMFIGLFVGSENLNPATSETMELGEAFVSSLSEVGIAILPILALFLIYNFVFLKLHKEEFLRIIIGLVYTYLGLVIFLTAANYGFISIARNIGKGFGEFHILILIMSFFIGASSVLADPSVSILVHQVEDISNGIIKKRTMLSSLAIGVGLTLVIAVTRAIYFPELPVLYILAPGYAVALILTIFSEDLYVALAFDSGGVAAGTMASCFVLPFMFGLSSITDVGTSGFGVIGMLGMMPIITVQLVGVLSNLKHVMALRKTRQKLKDEYDMQVIRF